MASGRAGLALGTIQRLFDEGTLTGLTDAQLLDRFLTRRDEAAFDALVARHGPMVLAVCRGVLKHASDAEDAFQATFLVLFRKASGLRSAGSLGSWLYRVAYRIALRANAVAARRRQRFSEEGMMAAESAASGEAEVDRELLPILHAEIDRLPDKYRAPIALCYLEGLSYEQAAHQLGWPLGTVGSRIARARELLRSRLSRRGVTATTAALSALLAREATAAPAGWVEATTRAAMGLGAGATGAKAAGAVSAAVALSDQVLRRMFMIRLIQMISLLAVVGTAGWLGWASLGGGGESKARNRPAPAAQEQARGAEDTRKAEAGQGPIRGRVLSPDGKPVADAAVYAGQPGAVWLIEPVARTGADGRFQCDPAEVSRKLPRETPPLDWKKAQVMAVAPGYGGARPRPAYTEGGDVELRLQPDDVPIRGRVLDTQGRPVAGATVRVGGIYDPPAGDLDALLASGGFERDQINGGFYDVTWWWTKEGKEWTRRTIETGPDGRFQVDGAGRDRLVLLEIEGPGIGSGRLWAMTRTSPPSARPRPAPSSPYTHPQIYPLRGATFDHVASPSKPIEGVVRVKGTGRPVPGIRVSAHVQESEASASATTDKDGRFRLDGLPKVGSYQVRAVPVAGQPYLQASIKVSDADGLKPIPVTLDLPRGVVIRGRLIDRTTGKSVAGQDVAWIKLPTNTNEGHGSHSPPFGPDGFRMTVPPGPALFRAQAAGTDLPYTRARLPEAVRRMGVGEIEGEAPIRVLISGSHVCRMVDVPADVETFTVDLELTRGATRTGRVVDPDGRPVVGAVVYGLTSDWEVKTLDGSSFEVIGLEPGRPRTVSFMHKDRRLAAAVAFGPGEGPIEVRLAPCGSAVGRVVDPDGQPLAGARIGISLRDRGGEQIPLNIGLWPSGEFFSADDQGRFRIEGLTPDLIARLSARPRSRPDVFLIPEGAKRAAFEHLEAKPGETVELGEIPMKRPPNG